MSKSINYVWTKNADRKTVRIPLVKWKATGMTPKSYMAQTARAAVLFPLLRTTCNASGVAQATLDLIDWWRRRIKALRAAGWCKGIGVSNIVTALNCMPDFVELEGGKITNCGRPFCPFCYGRDIKKMFRKIQKMALSLRPDCEILGFEQVYRRSFKSSPDALFRKEKAYWSQVHKALGLKDIMIWSTIEHESRAPDWTIRRRIAVAAPPDEVFSPATGNTNWVGDSLNAVYTLAKELKLKSSKGADVRDFVQALFPYPVGWMCGFEENMVKILEAWRGDETSKGYRMMAYRGGFRTRKPRNKTVNMAVEPDNMAVPPPSAPLAD